MGKNRKSRRSRKKQKPDKKSIPGTFNIGKGKDEGFFLIDRIWAEMGVIRVVTKEGQHQTFTPHEAAVRAASINAMKLPPWHAKNRNALVQKIIETIREAKYQQENKSTLKTSLVTNVLQGLTAEGKVKGPEFDEDTRVQKYMFMYPLLSEREVRAIWREKKLDIPRKEALMSEVNTQKYVESGFSPEG